MNTSKQVEYYRAKYRRNPESRVFAPLADLYRRDGRLVEAVQLLKEGLKANPGYVSALVVLGRCYLDAEDRQAAREVLQQVLDIDQENLVVLKLLAEEAGRREIWAEAADLMGRVLHLDPGDTDAESKLDEWRANMDEPAAGEVRETEPVPEAVPESRPGIFPGDVDPLPLEVVERVPTSGDDESELASGQQQVLATRTLADVYLAQGYRDKALNVLQQILDRDPQREDVRGRIAELEEEDARKPEVESDPSLGPAVAPIPQDEQDAELKYFENWLTKLRDKKKESAE